MHPLDAIDLDGFETVATCDVVLRASTEAVWHSLALANDETIFATTSGAHAVIDRFGHGEHRCTTTLSVEGRTTCVRGLRRLLAHREVLEVRRFAGYDELIQTTFTPARFGRTVMTVTESTRVGEAGLRGVTRHWATPSARCRLAHELVGCRSRRISGF